MQKFINKNKEFWENTTNEEVKGNLLVENPSDALFISHCMAMQTLLIHLGCGYKPLWIRNTNIPIELLQSYVPQAEYIDLPRLNIIEKLQIRLNLIIQLIKIFFNQKIISYKFDGIKYGDIIYDEYLVQNEVASIKKLDSEVIRLMHEVAKKHLTSKKAIKEYKIDAVLTSHKIGLESASLVRAGIISDCKVYTNYGMHKNTLMVSKGLEEMIEYGYTAKQKDVDKILTLSDEEFNKKFEEIKNEHLYGNLSWDAKYAYSDDNAYFKDRESFCEKYNLDINKKNIFIMLHAFTDGPHSHFKGMLFKDYGDWFLETLKFAKKDKNVNWIFKQHPSDRYYPTKDIVFSELFKNIPNNILFLSSDDKLDTRSVGNIGDAIVTCAGSAGFEMPAFFALPTIVAGDNSYQGFDFAKKAKTKKEYFEILANLKTIEKISKNAQKQARAVYMFIYRFAVVPYSFIPILSFDDHNDPNLNKIFFDKVLDLYGEKEEQIKNEITKYAIEVSKDDFKALRTDIRSYNDCKN